MPLVFIILLTTSYISTTVNKVREIATIMNLLVREEISTIIEQYGNLKVIDFTLCNYSDTMIGYLGEHLKLTVTVENNGVQSAYKFFVKCMPKDQRLADYLKESNFFRKEYAMLSDLFQEFDRHEETYWRPRLLYIKNNLFVFEDVKELRYEMAQTRKPLKYNEMKSVVETLAQFHALSFIYEENKYQELRRPYRIWEDFSDYLQESKDHRWRNAGRNAVIEYIKVHSRHKSEPNFSENITNLMISLFDDALNLMRPSLKYRNTVVHRDLWSNNILMNNDCGKWHTLIIDFQTVLYCAPTLDLSSLIYLNTTKEFRDVYMNDILDLYYDMLSNKVEHKVNVDFSTILSKSDFIESYNESVLFGMTQAAIVVPITAMEVKKSEELYRDAESAHRINNVSRSKEILDVAEEDASYSSRLTELFDEIVDRYYPVNKKV